MSINTAANITNHDLFYDWLIQCHRDLSDAQSQALNARLILILANHIGDLATLLDAMSTAREAVRDR